MTRIIAGTARGRRLGVPSHGTRPTADRVREALFSSLDSELAALDLAWSDIRVLDVFAGSGAFGLEALSRGAASAVLIEKSRAAARMIAANAETVACPGAVVIVRDAWLVSALPPPEAPVQLCFVDPPYEEDSARIRDLLSDLAAHGWLAPEAFVVVERPGSDAESPIPQQWGEARRRPYGDTALWYGRVTGSRREERA